MEEERPSEDSTSEYEETTSSRPSGLLIGGIILVAILIIAGLSLPPISIWERLGGGNEDTVAETDDEATAAPTKQKRPSPAIRPSPAR